MHRLDRKNQYCVFSFFVSVPDSIYWTYFHGIIFPLKKPETISIVKPTRLSILIKIQPDATVYRYLFTTKSLYMFRVSHHPSSGVLKTVISASGTGHTTCTATYLQRRLIGTQPDAPVSQIILFWNDTVHVSDGLSAHHQEFKTVHTATGYLSNWYYCLLAGGYEVFHLIPASKQTAVSVWQMPVAVCTVLNSWWWTERPSEACRVSFQNKMNLIYYCIWLVLL